MRISATTVEEYLTALPADRAKALSVLREVIWKNIDKAHFSEGLQYGMVGYFIPHSVYPSGYHCDPREPLPYIGLGSQKNHMALYLMGIYVDEENAEWFRNAWLATGKKLDMGKACVRFKRIEDVPLDVLAELVRKQDYRRVIQSYEEARDTARKGGKPTASPAKKTIPAKKASAAKQAVPAKKAVPAKEASPAKKTAHAKEVSPAKKAVPAKKTAPAKKAVPAKKASPVKKSNLKPTSSPKGRSNR